ncbi:MAG: ABC transporter ATP-binding protein [Chloroflexi bacterium]|nr:MAG: ABC transporter ATP-binding protein [Chloroflexota bacterium]TMG14198.1 MAG: ABC transporter ATP-binding protein [Chloroflexota bacterium]
MAPAIEVRELVKRYRKGTVNAVDGVSFDVEQGQFFALLGPNGAGKTTTISILTTTLGLTSGTVKIAGHDVVREASAVRREVGIIFQNPSLDMNLNGEENIRFHAALYRLYPYRPMFRLMPAAYRRQVRELADVVGLGAEVFKPVRRLSGGMRRKLEIIRGLMHHPKVLFLDEPTSGLDTASRRNLWQYISELRKQRDITICLTTHQLAEAEDADRVCIIDHGHVVAMGAPSEVKSELVREKLHIDAADRSALRRRLQKLKVPFSEDGHFVIHLDGRSAYEVVHSIEQPLTMLRTESATLEDAYLRLLAREDA